MSVDELKALTGIILQHPNRPNTSLPLDGASRQPSNGILTPTTPSPLSGEKKSSTDPNVFWEDGRHFDALLTALLQALASSEVGAFFSTSKTC